MLGSDGYDERKYAVSSPSLTEETISTQRQQLSGTLTSSTSLQASPLPTLPFDLIPEILSRLPVKLLMQFRCICKSWNSLISDPKFAKKHLPFSTKHLVHTLTSSGLLKSYPLDSIITNINTNHIAQLKFPYDNYVTFVGSCNGILCLADSYGGFAVTLRLWNPYIRKSKNCPPLEIRTLKHILLRMYGFGYDPVRDNYKVVAGLRTLVEYSNRNLVYKKEMKVYTLGTNSWKSIPVFPFVPVKLLGQCVSGTINWLASKDTEKNQCFILSIDLGNESFQEILLPKSCEVDAYKLQLSVLKDCLCMFSGNDVWVMKEYGNKESWTKLFTISNMSPFIRKIYIFEDDQVLLTKSTGDWKEKHVFYNRRDGTLKFTEFECTVGNTKEVSVESLISPCF